jgi:DNA-directed RNA polymerase subunit beta'
LTRQILVQDGDFVKAGAALSDGQTAPADILAIKGPFAVQEYVVNEIQEVTAYRVLRSMTNISRLSLGR